MWNNNNSAQIVSTQNVKYQIVKPHDNQEV